jgi:hypothetical protein
MDRVLKFDGIPFRVEYEQDRLIDCVPLCPDCRADLKKEVSATGTAMYVCPTQGQGCETPAKVFADMNEMAEFERAASTEVARYIQREADADTTYRLPARR